MNNYETKMERKALFREAVEIDLDRVTKELLDSAERLTWGNVDVNVNTIDRWIDTINAGLYKLRALRIEKVQAVRA